MIIKKTTITKGFLIAGLMNATVLIFSKLFTNSIITEFDPQVMSNFGLLMILIWGLTYMSVAKKYHEVKWLVGIFVIEKFIYGFIWTNWIINNNVYDVYKKDVLAGLFYSIYGINDWVFFIFFLSVFIHLFRTKNSA
ncbi:hypothetical protein SAMN05444395_11018 [Flavobacterium fryxellicola]|uniref:Uncharacterized protein n=1 Tax=Flavobacterium fryxellicola TaxID=249352 RepID=A0A167ZEF2_9FLAO|nr:hypothetical protein [Flavobacterium fryxellicola]OAB30360.1 hypothetical protein FBFR_02235 [Flavobacterium fryxellicola]SHN75958.1 hypothetical protein SAMN05444395_11018 [Flavobacterium fryxellicola]